MLNWLFSKKTKSPIDVCIAKAKEEELKGNYGWACEYYKVLLKSFPNNSNYKLEAERLKKLSEKQGKEIWDDFNIIMGCRKGIVHVDNLNERQLLKLDEMNKESKRFIELFNKYKEVK